MAKVEASLPFLAKEGCKEIKQIMRLLASLPHNLVLMTSGEMK
jgi:hypothetical protein